jgi:hypothetical protein
MSVALSGLAEGMGGPRPEMERVPIWVVVSAMAVGGGPSGAGRAVLHRVLAGSGVPPNGIAAAATDATEAATAAPGGRRERRRQGLRQQTRRPQ